TLMALALEEPPAIRSLNPEAPAGLIRLVAALLKKRPEDRPASASAVIELLEDIEREYAMKSPTAVVGKATIRRSRTSELNPPVSRLVPGVRLLPRAGKRHERPEKGQTRMAMGAVDRHAFRHVDLLRGAHLLAARFVFPHLVEQHRIDRRRDCRPGGAPVGLL